MVWGDFQPLQKYAVAVLTFWHMLSFPLLSRLSCFIQFFQLKKEFWGCFFLLPIVANCCSKTTVGFLSVMLSGLYLRSLHRDQCYDSTP